MAGLQPYEEGLSITHSHSSTFSLPSRSKTMNRGAGCLKGARPDLWGAGEGDFPRLPDLSICTIFGVFRKNYFIPLILQIKIPSPPISCRIW